MFNARRMIGSGLVIAACRLHVKTCSIRAGYRLRHSGRPSVPVFPGRRSKSRTAMLRNEDPEEVRARVEEAEHVQDWIESNMQNQSEAREIVGKEAARMKQQLIKKIIERKYFKTPQETNYLSWSAKEQIRYLHAEFPEEWTVARIATSFPISEEGVKKLLKSKRVPKSAEDIRKHDASVQKHWLALDKGDNTKGSGSLGGVHENKANPLPHAAFNDVRRLGMGAMLPPELNVDTFTNQTGKQDAPGLFESIVKSYCDKTQRLNECSDKNEASKNLSLNNLELEESHMLESDVTGSTERLDELRSKFKSKLTVSHLSDRDTSRFANNETGRKSLLDANFYENQNNSFIERRRTGIESYGDEFGEEDDKRMSSDVHSDIGRSVVGRRRRGLAGRRKDSEFITGEDVQLDAMKGTKKVSNGQQYSATSRWKKINENRDESDSKPSDKHRNRQENGYHEIVEEEGYAFRNASQPSRFEYNNSKAASKKYIKPSEVYDEIRYDSPASGGRGGGGSEDREAFIYDADTGYSHPFGRRSEVPEPRISVKTSATVARPEGTTYRKGNAYYDEDGELLFRTP